LKAQGDGWYTTITLIEGENIVPTDSGMANPYVVFTCNGKSRTSSVKLRTSQPNWRGRCAYLFKSIYYTVEHLLYANLSFLDSLLKDILQRYLNLMQRRILLQLWTLRYLIRMVRSLSQRQLGMLKSIF